ncbi:hypothetical protein EV207_17317, partial [Scopulibacillus darangshiensis]
LIHIIYIHPYPPLNTTYVLLILLYNLCCIKTTSFWGVRLAGGLGVNPQGSYMSSFMAKDKQSRAETQAVLAVH